ncbi:hypothetical protein ACFQ61_08575 [Streptomyces sp. NPDC056500]|uniref:hypothetical protein n=1 Tax=Streptomyces sp. NPDC056500 TaxID=3345840 RepID=UPI00367AB180
MIIKEGTLFSTATETGCVALSDSDEVGEFRARDSSGVEREFTTNMLVSAHPPEFKVVARLDVDGAVLHVTDQVAVSCSLDEATQALKAQPADLFGVWEAGEDRPTAEEAEEWSQIRLPQSVHVYAGKTLWLLDDTHTSDTKSPCRG